jgi:hypothetical protein
VRNKDIEKLLMRCMTVILRGNPTYTIFGDYAAKTWKRAIRFSLTFHDPNDRSHKKISGAPSEDLAAAKTTPHDTVFKM